MEKIIWSGELVTGFELIDFQHLLLIEQINELISMFNGEIEIDNYFDVLSFLVYYCNFHFITEEAMFKNIGYSSEESHTKEHERFIIRIRNFIDTYQRGIRSLDEESILFFKDWLLHHILYIDKSMAKELNEHINNKIESK